MFENNNLSEVEFNHRKFCDLNNIKYGKFYYENDHQKYSHVYRILEENIDEYIIFIDQYSWFKSYALSKSVLSISDLIIVKHKSIYENFFIVKSTLKIRKLFKEFLANKSISTYTNQYDAEITSSINNLMNQYVLNMLDKHENMYLNLDATIVTNCFDIDFNSCLVQHVQNTGKKKNEFANILCQYKQRKYITKSEPYELVNPGCPNAFVMLYTKNIENIGIISETNISRWCKENNFSLYVYRDIPEEMKNINGKKMSGNWLKPHLIKKHLDDHQYISWVDSDILITKDYKLTHTEDIEVYTDPLNWFFNSGFMSFKNVKKNHLLLNFLIQRFNELEDTSRVYVNGGDQKYFIEVVKSIYPDMIVRSNHNTNVNPSFPFFINPNQPALIHFMGYPNHIRIALMDAYEQIISAS